MQTIVRNVVLNLDNPDLSILPDKIKAVAERNLLKIETSIHVDADSKKIGQKLWDYVLCSLVGTAITAIIGYATGVFKVSSSLTIISYLFICIMAIFLFLQWWRHAFRKDDIKAKNKELEQLTITEPKLIKLTEFEKLARKIMVQNSDKFKQNHINDHIRDVIREIASVYYFLREAMGMEYIEITLVEFESVQQQLLQTAARETNKLRHFILNLFGYKTAWQYYLENKFFHKNRCPFNESCHDKWIGVSQGRFNDYVYTAYPYCLYHEDRVGPLNIDLFLRDIGRKNRTMPPNVLELAKEIYSKRYDMTLKTICS